MIAEHEIEPVRGLPGPLPTGERLLWQGEPHWWSLAQRVFHVKAIAAYFVVLLTARAVVAGPMEGGMAPFAWSLFWPALAALSALGLLLLFAWLIARTTVYSITSRRIVMRFGVALPLIVNIPFRLIETAGIKHHADGTGDIPLGLCAGHRLVYLLMWPHVRPWRVARVEPMMRGVPQANAAAQILTRALADASDAEHYPAEPVGADEAFSTARAAA